jgi:hypothetical protein
MVGKAGLYLVDPAKQIKPDETIYTNRLTGNLYIKEDNGNYFNISKVATAGGAEVAESVPRACGGDPDLQRKAVEYFLDKGIITEQKWREDYYPVQPWLFWHMMKQFYEGALSLEVRD